MCEVPASGLAHRRSLERVGTLPASLEGEILGARSRQLCSVRQGALQGWAGVHGGSVGTARSLGTGSTTAMRAGLPGPIPTQRASVQHTVLGWPPGPCASWPAWERGSSGIVCNPPSAPGPLLSLDVRAEAVQVVS